MKTDVALTTPRPPAEGGVFVIGVQAGSHEAQIRVKLTCRSKPNECISVGIGE